MHIFISYSILSLHSFSIHAPLCCADADKGVERVTLALRDKWQASPAREAPRYPESPSTHIQRYYRTCCFGCVKNSSKSVQVL